MAKFQNVFAGMKSIVMAAVVMVLVSFASCDKSDNLFEYTTQVEHDTTVLVTPGDTIVKNDTIILDNSWKVKVKVVNYGDSVALTTDMENAVGEKHRLPGDCVFYPKKTDYQIMADQEHLSEVFANNGRTGGRTVREEVTDSGWWDVTTYFFPTADGNILVGRSRQFHLANLPYVRVSESDITSLIDPTMRTRALYKVKDAPIEASNLVTFEVVSINDSTFTEELTCDFNRFLMAEDDIASKRVIMQGTDTIDAQTLQDSVKIQVTMKSGKKHETVNYITRKSDYRNRTFSPDIVSDFSGYHFDHVVGTSVSVAEKLLPERSTDSWSLYDEEKAYSGAIAGEKPFHTEYYIRSERSQYKDEKWGIEVNFGYPNIRVEEGATTVNTVASDRADYDKAIVTNNVAIKLGRFSTPMNETKSLYKEIKIERTVKEKGFEQKKKVWTPTTLTCSAVYYKLWSDGTREETLHEWKVPRSLGNGPAFDRECKDNSNRTSKPSITNLDKTPKSYTDPNGGKWNGTNEKASIGATVEFNGAESWSLSWTASEYNNITLQVGDDICEFGSDVYDFTLTPSLGAATLVDGYNVYPYVGKLDYKFGDAESKISNNTGNIRVKAEKKIKREGFDDSRKQKIFTPTTVTFKAVYVTEWDDNSKDEVAFELVKNRNLKNGPSFERTALDNTNKTSSPTTTDMQSSPKTQKGDKGEEWSMKEEKSTIGAEVTFNGASKADVIYTAEEVNDVVLSYKGAKCDFGHDNYKYTLSPSLGSGSVKNDYTVYQYTAKLNYTFGSSASKSVSDTGTIKVAVPEEETFFPKTWGKLQYVSQTTTISENQKKWDYVWSLHFYNEQTKEYRVLPVILAYASPDVPKWDFSLVEKCAKRAYELYNSAYYMPGGIKNAWAEDNKEHMQWSIAAEGSEKMSYGSMRLRTAEDKAWDWESAVNGHATVKTHRYQLTVTDGRLFAKDTYNNTKITDSHCVNGGWK